MTEMTKPMWNPRNQAKSAGPIGRRTVERRVGGIAMRGLLVSAAMLLVVAGCSDDEPSADLPAIGSDADGDGDASSTTETSTADATTTTTAADDSTSQTTETTEASTTTESTLRGEPFDAFPDDGDVMAVVGVASDDELNIRAGPGTSEAIVATAAPTADDLVATGEGRLLESSIWYEVEVDGQTGWANIAFLAFLGGTDDATAEFLAGGDLPEAETMAELGDVVTAAFASEDPPSSIVQVVAPTVGDLAEVTYDVVGIGDDAVLGYRLHIFAVPEESGESFTLTSIERTTLCGRGLSGEACR